MRRFALALLALCIAWLGSAREAEAARNLVTLDVRAASGAEIPTHLCVVSEVRGPRTRHSLWDVLPKKPDRTAEGRPASWRVLPDAWGGEGTSQTHQHCSDDPVADCRPRLELPETFGPGSDLFVACTADTLLVERGEAEDARVLVVLLERLGGSPPPLESIRYTGGIATVGIANGTDDVVITARSLGGHYLPHRRSHLEESAEHRLIVFPVAPRCQWIDVTVPGARISERDRARFQLEIHGASINVEHCVGDLRGTSVVPVRMPRAPGVGTLDFHVDAHGSRASDARYGARWTGDWPDQPLELRATEVHFHWERPACIYPQDACPEAVLPETGTTCEVESSEEGCDYRCPGPRGEREPAELNLPLRVTFIKDDPVQRWNDTLARNGQTLTSYVPPTDIYLTADLHRWPTNIPANRIEEVRIYSKDGTANNYPITHVPMLEMPIPHGSCDPVRYRPIGDRKYDHGLATVSDGIIDFGPPQRTAKILSFGVMVGLGGGPAWEVGGEVLPGDSGNPGIFFSGMAQISARFRPRRPNLARLAVEVRALGTLGQFGFATQFLGVGEVDPEKNFQKVGWARVLAEPALLVDATHRLAFSLGSGVGVSFPIRRQEELTSDLLSFVVSPNADIRFKVTPSFAFLLQVRTFIEQSTRTETDAMGVESVNRFIAVSLMTLGAAEVTF